MAAKRFTRPGVRLPMVRTVSNTRPRKRRENQKDTGHAETDLGHLEWPAIEAESLVLTSDGLVLNQALAYVHQR